MKELQDAFTSISVFLAASGVIIAVVYYFFYLRNLSKVRKSELFMNLFGNMDEAFHEADLLLQYTEYSDYADFEKQYGAFSARKPIHKAARIIAFYFEAVGMLMYRKLIDEQMVWDVFQIKHRWEKVAPLIKQLRKELDEPRYLEWFEYLYNWYLKEEKRGKFRQQPIYRLKP